MKLLALLLTMLFTLSLHAQDLIVTNQGDSIHCKITSINSEKINFTFNKEGKRLETLISPDSVKYHEYNHYKKPYSTENVEGTKPFPVFRLAGNIGFSRGIGKIDNSSTSELNEHAEQLQKGMNYEFNIQFFMKENLAIGLKYNNFTSSNSMSTLINSLDEGGNLVNGTLDETIKIPFYALSLLGRKLSVDKKSAFIYGVSLGSLGYDDKRIFKHSTIPNYELKNESTTLGLGLELGYDIGISNNFALGLQLSLIMGSTTELKIEDSLNNSETQKFDDDNPLSLSHVDFSIGLRFNQ